MIPSTALIVAYQSMQSYYLVCNLLYSHYIATSRCKSRELESAPTGSLDSGTDTGNQGIIQQTQQKIITPRINPGIFSGRKFNLVIQGIPVMWRLVSKYL